LILRDRLPELFGGPSHQSISRPGSYANASTRSERLMTTSRIVARGRPLVFD